LRKDLALLALLGALLSLPVLGSRDLWNPDEARYAEVAREMRLESSWAIPRLNGEVYTQKPPLLFWLIIASSYLTGGVGEVSARLNIYIGRFNEMG
jgi:4-amino-4-deoxy-L-arabinose transferase-like glycosyltransferase